VSFRSFQPRQNRRAFLQLLSGSLLAACSGAPVSSESDDLKHSSKLPPSSPVLVIGAGISGLAAASTLKRRGFTNVRVIEARNRLGGRVLTDRSLGTPFDLGAAWVHLFGDKRNPFPALFTQLGFATKHTDWDKITAYDEKSGVIAANTMKSGEASFEAALKEAARRIRALPDQHVSLASVLDPIVEPLFSGVEQARLRDFLRGYYIENEYAASTQEIGAYDLSDFDTSKAVENDQLVSGYDRLIESLVAGLDVRLDEPVRKVRLDPNGVTVETSRGTHVAAAGIVTLPIGVLRSGAVEFEPRLPDAKRRAIEQIGFGDFEKAILLYDQAFWPQTPHGFGFASADAGAASLILNVQAVAGTPALVAMFTGAAARAASSLSDQALRARAVAQIRSMFGPGSPEPRAVLRTRWHDDPNSLGAYTYPGIFDHDAAVKDLAAPIEGKLFFAGEATDTVFYSYAHGAYTSGIRAANEL
jgi:monoamine oxidase